MFDGSATPYRTALRTGRLKPLLRLEGVCKSFCAAGREVRVLDDINLTLHAGVMVAIVGPSGSGKSTLMNILGCLDRPSAGRYVLGGRDTRSLGSNALARLRRRHFGFVFQRYQLLPRLTVLENVEMPAAYTGLPAPQRRLRAVELLTKLGLAERLGHFANQLSGGQQQRVAIARALINDAAIILADEPTGALDTVTGRATLRTLLDLQALGRTVVLVTHDRDVAAYAERIIELRDGRIVSDAANPCRAIEPPPGVSCPSGQRKKSTRPTALRKLVEAFDAASHALRANRLRTALTMLGIAIGAAAVVSIMAVGEGNRRHMKATIGALASNLIEFRRGSGWNDSQASAVHSLSPGDLAAVQMQPYVEAATPLTQVLMAVRYRDANADSLVMGVGDGFFKVRAISVVHGRSIRTDDIERQAQVAVIDQVARNRLFTAGEDPVGKVIIIGNVPCTVVGVTSDASQQLFAGPGPNVLLPYTTAGVRVFGRLFFDAIVVRAAPGDDGRLVERSLTRLLAYQHGAKDFFTNNMDLLARAYESSTRSISLMLSLIASIALLVGGVGVMNILLVSVTERTREIGLRMAVGARRVDIARQFLAESVIICLIGGACGVSIALLAGLAFSFLVKEWHMAFTADAFVLALGSVAVIGTVFGIVPSRRAAALDPCQALLRE